jgi:hypothetical protein
MKNISTGTGLCVLGLCLASYPIIDRVMPRAEAGATHVAAVVAAATAQVPATVVWMGVCEGQGVGGVIYHRLWSDGRQEFRYVPTTYAYNGCTYELFPLGCPSQNWVEVPPPPSGNGFACRADLDGNRIIDGADLGMVLANWGPQTPCAPEATYPCLTLNQPLLK